MRVVLISFHQLNKVQELIVLQEEEAREG